MTKKSMIVIGALFLLIIGLVFSNVNQSQEQGTGYSPLSNDKQEELEHTGMDQVLADDLSMTTSMFLSQLSLQLQRWAEQDISTTTLRTKFEEELGEHPHFEGFAIVEEDDITVSVGHVQDDKVKEITTKNATYSSPYQYDDKQYMVMREPLSETKDVIGVIDLQFVTSYVKEIASVADGNGNFFISGGDNTKAKWTSTKDLPENITAQTVPELGWQIVVHSDEEGQEQREYYPRQAVVKFTNEEEGLQWLDNNETLAIMEDSSPYYVIESTEYETVDLVQMLPHEIEIDFVEPNYVITKQATTQVTVPNDEFFAPYQWNLSQISAESGWNFSGGDEDIIIAILDTGVDPDHQDLAGKVLEGFNAIDGSSDTTDEHGHGTHVAGIAAALTNNVTGIAGVAWENLILPIKVLDENGEGTSFEVARGIRWAVDNGAQVINMSLGDYHSSFALHDAIKYADRHDVILIAASGNDNVSTPMYPARYKEVLTVGAVTENRERAFFSNYGGHIDVTAPGEHIPSLFPNNNYVVMSGTSMAAPHVAGLAGLIKAANPELTNKQIYRIIKKSSEDLGRRGRDPFYGHGEINVSNALQKLR
ncbi:S8 family peptidase [Alkalihalobacillus sp. LMS39]|uniref:S8 family peptidase n=1 Tax=Alkalihalobacillus sp. LMS39 TaxID=2924032 RepID=UPI001FB4FC5F|nr:S8 family peptidase [Alkalihalobacillus sp. LMS39]UOE95985.1 S8 family peptidase [Alkalihalobacillus sp. LMS39]